MRARQQRHPSRWPFPRGLVVAVGLAAAGGLLPGTPPVPVAAEEAADPEAALQEDGIYAVFETTLGTFACKLEPERAPVTVGNFVGLVEGTQPFRDPRTQEWVQRPFYDGLKFHRIVKDFVVQGGDPLGDGTGGPGYAFLDEFDPELRHDRPGILSMANSGPNTNGSQFFITLAPAPWLDRRHTVFGHVVYGMDVLQRMARQPMTGPERSTPVSDIFMERVRIVRRGAEAENFDAQAAFASQASILAERERRRQERAAAFQAELTAQLSQARSTPSGMRYVVTASGHGDPPQPGDAVVTHYAGYLEDGTRFDSSYEHGKPFRFWLGQGRVIKGWEEAFRSMRPGEKRRVVLPPELGYGPRGNRQFGIPPDATLIFDLELVNIEKKKKP